MLRKFRGTGVALVTPFTDEGQVDYEGLKRVIEHTIKGKVEYLVSLGTTGESVTLSKEEKLKVLEFTITTVSGRVPLVAGFGGNNTAEVVESIKKFHFNGVEAILSVSPYYNKPTQEGIYRHYRAIAEASPVPVILYNVPGRTASNITAQTTLRLAHDCPNIIGIKEASGDFLQVMAILRDKPEHFFVVSGDDALTLPQVLLGCDGVISVVANAFPAEFSEMVRAALHHDLIRARKMQYRLLEIMQLLFREGNPAGVKCALEILQICGSAVRLPLVPASDTLRKDLKAAILALENSKVPAS
ncbi:MAG: 4-hydroxy-tetrahydrodipicolinate synthase [Chitinophagales bacterium]|nr:MAG: 4-hydroxy-tetrahydrodipicolinate synthase [Chitinophagales bacterium]GIV35510.1 MAG: 4-hydroxy-tetrahydrodipicolinate synthase [Chitinophagales bacterium]